MTTFTEPAVSEHILAAVACTVDETTGYTSPIHAHLRDPVFRELAPFVSSLLAVHGYAKFQLSDDMADVIMSLTSCPSSVRRYFRALRTLREHTCADFYFVDGSTQQLPNGYRVVEFAPTFIDVLVELDMMNRDLAQRVWVVSDDQDAPQSVIVTGSRGTMIGVQNTLPGGVTASVFGTVSQWRTWPDSGPLTDQHPFRYLVTSSSSACIRNNRPVDWRADFPCEVLTGREFASRLATTQSHRALDALGLHALAALVAVTVLAIPYPRDVYQTLRDLMVDIKFAVDAQGYKDWMWEASSTPKMTPAQIEALVVCGWVSRACTNYGATITITDEGRANIPLHKGI